MRTLCILCTLIFTGSLFSQKNTVFAEIGGNAQGTSINFERQLTKEKGLMLRIGLGLALVQEEEATPNEIIELFGAYESHFSIPTSLEYLFNIKNGHYIETGVGYTWIDIKKNFDSAERGTHNFIASIGYRKYFGSQKSWMWKANFSPILAGNDDSGIKFGFSPMFGIAIGKRL